MNPTLKPLRKLRNTFNAICYAAIALLVIAFGLMMSHNGKTETYFTFLSGGLAGIWLLSNWAHNKVRSMISKILGAEADAKADAADVKGSQKMDERLSEIRRMIAQLNSLTAPKRPFSSMFGRDENPFSNGGSILDKLAHYFGCHILDITPEKIMRLTPAQWNDVLSGKQQNPLHDVESFLRKYPFHTFSAENPLDGLQEIIQGMFPGSRFRFQMFGSEAERDAFLKNFGEPKLTPKGKVHYISKALDQSVTEKGDTEFTVAINNTLAIGGPDAMVLARIEAGLELAKAEDAALVEAIREILTGKVPQQPEAPEAPKAEEGPNAAEKLELISKTIGTSESKLSVTIRDILLGEGTDDIKIERVESALAGADVDDVDLVREIWEALGTQA